LERKLTAILCADVHGYSRLMGEDEAATLRTLSAYRKIIDPLSRIIADASSTPRAIVSWPNSPAR
jgi:class 3 adenylate cyclase